MNFWNSIYSIGIKDYDNEQVARDKRINNQVTFFTFITVAFFIPYLLLVNNNYYVFFEIIFTALIAGSLVFNYFGLINLSLFWRFAIVTFDVTLASLEMPNAGFEYFFIPLALIPFILSNSTKIQVMLFLFSLAFFFLRKFLSETYVPHAYLTKDQNLYTYCIVMFTVFLLCCLFVIKFKLASNKYEEVIKVQLNEIEEQKKDILDSIAYAKRLQIALLPPIEEFQKALSEYFIFYKPKDIVSGDFYWLERQGDKVFVAVADCTGHGVPGAMMSVLCLNTLNRVVRELGILKPSLILDKAALLMEEQLSKSGMNVMDGMDIGLCCIDYSEQLIEFSGAYNPCYIISNGNLNEIKGDKQPIGKMENRKLYTNHTLKLLKGDCYYLLSDGFSDQFGGQEEKKYSSKRLKANLLLHHSKLMSEQQKILRTNIEDWQGNLSQVDDICILGFRV